MTRCTEERAQVRARFNGWQEGFGPIPRFELFTLEETVSARLRKGTTVSRRTIEQEGFEVFTEGNEGRA